MNSIFLCKNLSAFRIRTLFYKTLRNKEDALTKCQKNRLFQEKTKFKNFNQFFASLSFYFLRKQVSAVNLEESGAKLLHVSLKKLHFSSAARVEFVVAIMLNSATLHLRARYLSVAPKTFQYCSFF